LPILENTCTQAKPSGVVQGVWRPARATYAGRLRPGEDGAILGEKTHSVIDVTHAEG
jgi:hypothetical protein